MLGPMYLCENAIRKALQECSGHCTDMLTAAQLIMADKTKQKQTMARKQQIVEQELTK